MPADSHDCSVWAALSYTSSGPTALGGRNGRSTVTMLFGCLACNAAFERSSNTSNGGAISPDQSRPNDLPNCTAANGRINGTRERSLHGHRPGWMIRARA